MFLRLLEAGVPFEALFGKEKLDRGLTVDEMQLLLLAKESIDAQHIDDMTAAFGLVMGGEDSAKGISKYLTKKRQAIAKHLIRME